MSVSSPAISLTTTCVEDTSQKDPLVSSTASVGEIEHRRHESHHNDIPIFSADGELLVSPTNADLAATAREPECMPSPPSRPLPKPSTYAHIELVGVDSVGVDKLLVDNTRIQNFWGECGILRWVGKIKKGDWGKGIYAAVEYDLPNDRNETRGDGSYKDVRYVTTSPHTCGFSPLRHLYFEVNPLVVKFIRAHFGSCIAFLLDFEVVKFAIARQFDMARAINMIQNHLEWRHTFKPRPYNEWFHPEIAEAAPIGDPVNAYDREGNLLHYAQPALKMSPAQFIQRFGVEGSIRWTCLENESMKAKLRALGFKKHFRFCSIYDLKDVGIVSSGLVMDYAQDYAEIAKNHQPEIIAKVFLINCPLLFRAAFKMISVFLDERTKAKVIVLGPDYKEELEAAIDPAFIPTFAGGQNDTWLNEGGRIGAPAPSANPATTFGIIE